jgi:hypothetical protein
MGAASYCKAPREPSSDLRTFREFAHRSRRVVVLKEEKRMLGLILAAAVQCHQQTTLSTAISKTVKRSFTRRRSRALALKRRLFDRRMAAEMIARSRARTYIER